MSGHLTTVDAEQTYSHVSMHRELSLPCSVYVVACARVVPYPAVFTNVCAQYFEFTRVYS